MSRYRYIRKLNIKCPKCRTNKHIIAVETVEACTEYTFKDGICDEFEDTAQDIGLGINMTFHCMNCDHIWTGRKGKTLDNYSDYID